MNADAIVDAQVRLTRAPIIHLIHLKVHARSLLVPWRSTTARQDGLPATTCARTSPLLLLGSAV